MMRPLLLPGCIVLGLAAAAHAADVAPELPAVPTAPAAPARRAPTFVDTVASGGRVVTDVSVAGVHATAGDGPAPHTSAAPGGADLDMRAAVVLGVDRVFDTPFTVDAQGIGTLDGTGPVGDGLYADDGSGRPRAQLYAAFLEYAPQAGEALAPMRVRVGRISEQHASPVSYDGASIGASWDVSRDIGFAARAFGGVDAPLRLPLDPFTRTAPAGLGYRETYLRASAVAGSSGAVRVQRRLVLTPQPGPVGGADVDVRLWGITAQLSHVSFATVARTALIAALPLPLDALDGNAQLRVDATNALPRKATLTFAALPLDAALNVAADVGVQFLPDACSYDCTFAAFDSASVFDAAAAARMEAARSTDQIRHLNLPPAREHVRGALSAQYAFDSGVWVLVRAAGRKQRNDADVDVFRTNGAEAGAGVGFAWGSVFEVGTELTAAAVDAGGRRAGAYDLRAEGVSQTLEDRVSARCALLDGRLRGSLDVFVRQATVESKSVAFERQWSGGGAAVVRFDLTDAWAASVRLEGDALPAYGAFDAQQMVSALGAVTFRM